MAAFKIEIDGREYLIPDDLDLNDMVAVEEQGWSLDSMGSMTAVRFMVHRLLLRENPDVTLEEAGSKVPLGLFMGDGDEEGPPPVPLSGQAPQSGTSGEHDNGNGSTGMSVAEVTHVHGGPR